MSTLRRALVLGTLTFLVAVLAGVALLDPFHLRHAGWFTAGLVLLGLLLLTATLAVAVTLTALRLVVVAAGAALMIGWTFTVWTATSLGEPDRPVSEVVSGAQRLVVLDGPGHRVVLRAGDGVFEQESLVWQGLAEGPAPGGTAFRGVDEVEVRAGSCVYVSRVEPVTLAVAPVHRSLRADGC